MLFLSLVHPLLLTRRKNFIRTQVLGWGIYLDPKCRDQRLEITFKGIYFRVVWWQRGGISGEPVEQEAGQKDATDSFHLGLIK